MSTLKINEFWNDLKPYALNKRDGHATRVSFWNCKIKALEYRNYIQNDLNLMHKTMEI